tara:strand:+ start:9846 stop:10397 length:552 start_codon:yes stop_codon:yes gene_type:complete
VRAAASLFRKNGYSKTGLNEILAESQAPKGSLYHYFPGGKEQLGEEALRFSSQIALKTLEELGKTYVTAPSLLLAFASLLADWMEQSSFHDGCPMATTILETVPKSSGIRIAAQEGFAAWHRIFEGLLRADGVKPEGARRLANLAVAGLEGSLIQARVEQDRRPIIECAEDIAALMTLRANYA